MKVIAIVPMKLNNRRLPQKNTKSFTNGKPLCYYILSTLLKVKEINEVYVYCSNPEIQNYIPDGVKYLKRSELLDQDTTKMNEVFSEEDRKSLEEEIPLGRFGTSEEIGKLAVFLASDDSSYITGQIIRADGGFI